MRMCVCVCLYAYVCAYNYSYLLYNDGFVLSACLLNGQVITLCANPEDCFTPGTESCVHLCNGCTCALPTVADNITGECVQPNQCTSKLYQPASNYISFMFHFYSLSN